MEVSKDPFGKTLDSLLAEREWSIRHLSAETRRLKLKGLRNQLGISHGAISAAMRGDVPLSLEAYEMIAKALTISPFVFAEYRIDERRGALDWRKVGLKRALRELGE